MAGPAPAALAGLPREEDTLEANLAQEEKQLEDLDRELDRDNAAGSILEEWDTTASRPAAPHPPGDGRSVAARTGRQKINRAMAKLSMVHFWKTLVNSVTPSDKVAPLPDAPAPAPASPPPDATPASAAAARSAGVAGPSKAIATPTGADPQIRSAERRDRIVDELRQANARQLEKDRSLAMSSRRPSLTPSAGGTPRVGPAHGARSSLLSPLDDRELIIQPVTPRVGRRSGARLWTIARSKIHAVLAFSGVTALKAVMSDDPLPPGDLPGGIDGPADNFVLSVNKSKSISALIRMRTGVARWRARSGAHAVSKLLPFVPMLLLDHMTSDAISNNHHELTQAATADGTPGGTTAGGGSGGPADAAGSFGAKDRTPYSSSFIGAMMVADISGFTPLTERLSKNGSDGVELLTRCMNAYFTLVINLVSRYGGDIIKFAGDSMLIVFKAPASAADAPDGGLALCALRAASCAADVIHSYGTMRILHSGEVEPVGREEKSALDVGASRARKRWSVAGMVAGMAAGMVGGESSRPKPPQRENSRGGHTWGTHDGGHSMFGPGGHSMFGGHSIGGQSMHAHDHDGEGAGAGGSAPVSRQISRSNSLAGGISLRPFADAADSDQEGEGGSRAGDSLMRRLWGGCGRPSRRAASRQNSGTGRSAGLRRTSSLPALPALLACASRPAPRLGVGEVSITASASGRYELAPLPADGGSSRAGRGGASCWGGGRSRPSMLEDPIGLSFGNRMKRRFSRSNSFVSPEPFLESDMPPGEPLVLVSSTASTPKAAGGTPMAPGSPIRSAIHVRQFAPLKPGGHTPPVLDREARSAHFADYMPVHPGPQISAGAAADELESVLLPQAFPAGPAASAAAVAPGSPFARHSGVRLAFGDSDPLTPAHVAARVSAVASPARPVRATSQLEPPASSISEVSSVDRELMHDVSPGGSERGAAMVVPMPAAGSGTMAAVRLRGPGPVTEAAEHFSLETSPSLQRIRTTTRRPSLGTLTVTNGGGPATSPMLPVDFSMGSGSGTGGLAAPADRVARRRHSLSGITMAPLEVPLGRSASHETNLAFHAGAATLPRGDLAGHFAAAAHSHDGPTSMGDESNGPHSMVRPARSRSNSFYGGAMAAVAASAGARSLARGDTGGTSGRFDRGTASMAGTKPALMHDTHGPGGGPPMMLSLKVTIGAGRLYEFVVGGEVEKSTGTQRWEYLVSDRPGAPAPAEGEPRQPITQIVDAEKEAASGDVILASEVGSLPDLADRCIMTRLPSGHFRLLGFSVEAGGPELPAPVPPPPPVAIDSLTQMVKARLTQLMRMHVVDNVRQRIEAGHQDFVNEIRVCTCVFLGIPSLAEPAPADQAGKEVERMQTVMRMVQRRLAASEGSLLQFRMDEKGFLMIGAFGLPGKTHEDDAVRGLRAALAITRSLKDLGHTGRVGVTTGQLFCACVGSALRTEYTVFGDTINLAARLMTKAPHHEVWCDGATWGLAKRRFRFIELEAMKFKGKAFPVQVFRVSAPTMLQQRHKAELLLLSKGSRNTSFVSAPSSRGLLRMRSVKEAGGSGVLAPAHPMPKSTWEIMGQQTTNPLQGPDGMGEEPLVGREPQLEALKEAVRHCVADKVGGLIMLHGEAGMGKSALVAEFERGVMSEWMGVGGDPPPPGSDTGDASVASGRADMLSDNSASVLGGPGGPKPMNVRLYTTRALKANSATVLHGWRDILRELFRHDREVSSSPMPSAPGSFVVGGHGPHAASSSGGTGTVSDADGGGTLHHVSSMESVANAAAAALTEPHVSKLVTGAFNPWRSLVAHALDLPEIEVPLGPTLGPQLGNRYSSQKSMHPQPQRTPSSDAMVIGAVNGVHDGAQGSADGQAAAGPAPMPGGGRLSTSGGPVTGGPPPGVLRRRSSTGTALLTMPPAEASVHHEKILGPVLRTGRRGSFNAADGPAAAMAAMAMAAAAAAEAEGEATGEEADGLGLQLSPHVLAIFTTPFDDLPQGTISDGPSYLRVNLMRSASCPSLRVAPTMGFTAEDEALEEQAGGESSNQLVSNPPSEVGSSRSRLSVPRRGSLTHVASASYVEKGSTFAAGGGPMAGGGGLSAIQEDPTRLRRHLPAGIAGSGVSSPLVLSSSRLSIERLGPLPVMPRPEASAASSSSAGLHEIGTASSGLASGATQGLASGLRESPLAGDASAALDSAALQQRRVSGSRGEGSGRGSHGGKRPHKQAELRRSKTAGRNNSADLASRVGGGAGGGWAQGLLMSPELRAKKVQSWLGSILAAASALAPTVVVIEDAQYLDSASAELAKTVAHTCKHLLLILTYRQLTHNEIAQNPVLAEVLSELTESDETQHIACGALSVEHTGELLRGALGPDRTVDIEVIEDVWEKTQGLPLYLSQIIAALKQHQTQAAIDATPLSISANSWLSHYTLKGSSIQQVITNRIDRLRPSQQLTLKVASVIGTTFSRQLLMLINPMGHDSAALTSDLEELQELAFVSRDGRSPHLYHFTTTLVRDVAYELIPFAQRRQLHGALANAFAAELAAVPTTGNTSSRLAGFGLTSEAMLTSQPTLDRQNSFILGHPRSLAANRGSFHLRQSTSSTTIAHHATLACASNEEDDPDMARLAIAHWAVAGEQAQERSAHEEVLRLYRRATQLDDALYDKGILSGVPMDVRAEWEQRLGTANLRLGAFPSAVRHLQVALERLNVPLPPDLPSALLRARLYWELRGVMPLCCGGRWGAAAAAEGDENAPLPEPLILTVRSLAEVAVLTDDVQLARYCRDLMLFLSDGARQPILRLSDSYANCSSVLSARHMGPLWPRLRRRLARPFRACQGRHAGDSDSEEEEGDFEGGCYSHADRLADSFGGSASQHGGGASMLGTRSTRTPAPMLMTRENSLGANDQTFGHAPL